MDGTVKEKLVRFDTSSMETTTNYSTTPYRHYVTSGPILEKLNEKQFEILIPSFVMVLSILIIGLPGNIVTLCVYTKKMRKTASRIFILALAWCDLLNCMMTMPVEIAIILSFWTFDHPIICSISRTMTYALNGISALLLCGIAVDRFRKICRPLKPVFTPKRTRSICIVSAALGLAVYIPGFLIYGTQSAKIEMRIQNIDVTALGKTCLISDKYVQSSIQAPILIFWFFCTIFVMTVLITMYTLIGRAVYKRLKLEEMRHYSVSNAAPLKKRRLVIADAMSETSCSFDDPVRLSSGHPPKVLKGVPEPVTNNISQAIKNRFSVGTSRTVYSLKKQRISKRIRAGRTTLMLFSVTIAYILSFVPFCVIVVLRFMYPLMYLSLSGIEKSFWNIFLRSYVFNCAINPVLYGFFNKDFRQKMGELFRDCLCF